MAKRKIGLTPSSGAAQALLPPTCRQPDATPAICPGLQSGQLPAQATLTEGNQQLVIAQSSSEADQIGGRAVHHTRRFVSQLAEVSRDLFAATMEWVNQVEPITRLSAAEEV